MFIDLSEDHATGLADHAVATRPAGLKPRRRTVAARSAAVGSTHTLKSWPFFFDAVLSGQKRFEVRRDDRGFAAGDMLRLREWSPNTGRYTGRTAWCKVLYVMRGGAFGLADGYSVLSTELVPTLRRPARRTKDAAR